MLMNKFDFESGLQQDKQRVTVQLPVQGQNKQANLFGQPQNFSSVPQQSNFQSQQEAQAKNKRDLLWEQKRKQRQDLVNPPIIREGQDNAFLDMMAPKYFPPPSSESQFQKAVAFEQPKVLIEMPMSKPNQRPEPNNNPPPRVEQQSFEQRPPSIQNYTPEPTPPMREPPSYQNQLQFQTPQQFQLNEDLPPMMVDSFPQNYQQPPQFNQQQFQNQQFQQQQFQQQNQYQPQNQALPASQPSSSSSYMQEQRPPSNQPQSQPSYISQGQQEQKAKQQEYLLMLQNEMKEKEEKKKRDKEERIRKEKEELQKNMNYNPFGKGGAGAPNRDYQGNVVVSRKPVNEQQNYRAQKPPSPAVNQYQQLQQFSPYQNQAPQPQNFPNAYQSQPQFPPQYQQIGQMDLPQFPQQFQGMGQPEQPFYNQMPPQMPPQFEPPGFSYPNPMMNNQQSVPIQQNMPFQQKLTSPEPITSKFQEPAMTDDGMKIGVFNEFEESRQKEQKKELNSVLKQQMEEQKRRKDDEARRKKEEEWREEQKILREREDIERQFKAEEDKKKAKFAEAQQVNAQLIQGKQKQKKVVEDDEGFQNYVVERKGDKPDIFGKQSSVVINQEIEPVNESFQMHQQLRETPMKSTGTPQMSQTRIIKDISRELKDNFKEEIGKLRDEMNSQQRVFREQMERMQIGNVSQIQKQKQDTTVLSEIEKIKLEIQQQREQERLEQQRVMYALDKHNPNKQVAPMEMLNYYDKPGPLPSQIPPDFKQNVGPASYAAGNYNPPGSRGSLRGGSRKESRESQRKVQMSNYEKMFFNNDGRGNSASQRREPNPQYNIKEEKVVRLDSGYMGGEKMNPYGQVNEYRPVMDYQPKIIKREESNINTSMMRSMKGESTLLPIDSQDERHRDFWAENYENKGGFQENKENSNFNRDQIPPPTMDKASYFDHLKSIGAGNVYLGTDGSDNTMEFVNKLVNGKDESAEKALNRQDQFADKLDGFNFNFNLPQIPQYDGIQNDYISNNHKKEPIGFLGEAPGMGFNQKSLPGEGTLNSMGTLNSLNLDKLNQKYDDRLAKFGTTNLNHTQNTNVEMGRGNYQSNPVRDSNEQLKQFDNELFDLLRNSEPGQPPYTRQSSGNKFVHLNSKNNYEHMTRMRETRDQFMAPSMGLINEDGGEEFDGTFKEYRGNAEVLRLPTNNRKYDSLLDSTNLALD